MRNNLYIIAVLLFVSTNLFAQEVIQLNNISGSLESKIKTAYDAAENDNEFWIGYKIKNDRENSVCIGVFNLGSSWEGLTLRDLIYNTEKFRKEKKLSQDERVKMHAYRTINVVHGSVHSSAKKDKELAILIKYKPNSNSIYDFNRIYIANLSYYVDLKESPVYWLGEERNINSYDYLKGVYKNSSVDLKEELIPAIGVHTDNKEVTGFLTNLLDKETDEDLLEEIPFWLGYQDNREAFNVLKKLLKESKSEEMQEDAVMGIAQLTFNDAIDELISIARKHRNGEIREEAIMWLGQKAVKKTEEALKNFVENDPDIEIKKRAVYALANSSDENFDYLFNIAKSNKSLALRKCAIYSISNFENEKALDALVEILNN